MKWTWTSQVGVVLGVLLLVGCGSSGTGGSPDIAGPDTPPRTDVAPESVDQDSVIFAETGSEDTAEDILTWDLETIDDTEPQPGCEPGEGCFLDPCSENDECLSGWCVEHMGQKVCTQTCQEECPEGWSCVQVGASEPDIVFICVSGFPNLCRPCTAAADCEGVAGTEDACVAYDDEGAFCGGKCGADGACPWGFTCETVTTVDGIELEQCVSDKGVCPCTDTSVELGLFTFCEVESEYGTCQGKRVCTEDGLTDCDAPEPAEETCNGLDDDCNGDVDEGDVVEGIGVCDDGNECTADQCLGADGCENVLLSEGECKDGDPCTVADHCEEGACVGNSVICDDGNPCTDDECDSSGGCLFTDNEDACDDGDPCTLDDVCGAGVCAGDVVPCECQTDEDCAALEDGDLCNGTLTCNLDAWPYQCMIIPETIVECDAPLPGPNAVCQQAFCDPGTGQCSVIADHEGNSCDDGDACTIGDQCVAGTCTPGVPAGCDDANPCTDDTCDPDLGCVFTDNVLPCDDGSVCTVGDTCLGGACLAGDPLSCVDENVCTDDSCDPLLGCVFVPNQAPCSDDIDCTLGDHCLEGACVYDELAPCDDGNPCTDDLCDPTQGCVAAFNEGPCDDGDVCTLDDHCALGECVADGALFCDDFNLCTDDSCDPVLGCLHTLNEAPCDDGDMCTDGETCFAGECAVGLPTDCDDGDPCTTESCDVLAGCQYQNICAGWSTVSIVSAAFTQLPTGTGTLTLTVGQPGAGLYQDDEISVHAGIGPISATE
jgi:hypothetical protein